VWPAEHGRRAFRARHRNTGKCEEVAAFASSKLDVPLLIELTQTLVDALRMLGEMPDAMVGLALDVAVDLLVRVLGDTFDGVWEHRRA
jgi:hypothetical protein